MNKQEFERQIKSFKSVAKTQEQYQDIATKVIQKYANENNLNYGQGLEAYKEVVNNIKNKQK